MVQGLVTEEIGLRKRNVMGMEGPKSLLYEQDGPVGGLGATIAIFLNAAGASDIDDRTQYRGMARQWVCTKRSLPLVETGGLTPCAAKEALPCLICCSVTELSPGLHCPKLHSI